MITTTLLIFFLGLIATACSLTGAILICRQEEQDFEDRATAKRDAKSQDE